MRADGTFGSGVCNLLAQALFPFAQFRGEFLAEILGLEYLPDLHFGAVVERCALQPFDGLFLRLALPQPEAGDQLLGLGEWAVGDGALAAVELHTYAPGTGLQPLAGQHHAGLDQFLVELAHRREQLRARHHAGFAVPVGFDDHHETHVVLLLSRGMRALVWTTNRQHRNRHWPAVPVPIAILATWT